MDRSRTILPLLTESHIHMDCQCAQSIFLMRQIVDGIRELMSEHSWAIDLRALDEMGDIRDRTYSGFAERLSSNHSKELLD
jgi:hypothetical protein